MNKYTRLHGIDALRAIAMLLGVVLHSTMAYTTKSNPSWINDDQIKSTFFDFTYFFIHSFRMPLFFIIAGYFCRLLYKRVEEKEFVKKRWLRIGVPFLLGVLIIVPIQTMPYNIYLFRYKQGDSWESAISKAIFRTPGTDGIAHLWFLSDLLVFYCVTIILMRLKKNRWFKIVGEKFTTWWKYQSFDKLYWPFIISLPVWLIFLNDQKALNINIIPPYLMHTICFSYLFGLGWLIHLRQDCFDVLIYRCKLLLIVGITIVCCLFYLKSMPDHPRSTAIILITKMLSAFITIFLSFGIIGLFLRLFNSESRFWKYVSDASYWVYLVHIIPVMWLQLAFINGNLPGFLRFWIVMITSGTISLVTYQWFVRYSIVGKILHGERKRDNLVKEMPDIKNINYELTSFEGNKKSELRI